MNYRRYQFTTRTDKMTKSFILDQHCISAQDKATWTEDRIIHYKMITPKGIDDLYSLMVTRAASIRSKNIIAYVM